jgi:hypothetical protein
MFDWTHYRRLKLRAILLLAGIIPFEELLLRSPFPLIWHTYAPGYVLAIFYMLFTGFASLQYGFYPCVNCEKPYRGQQLFRKRCSRCGILINQ